MNSNSGHLSLCGFGDDIRFSEPECKFEILKTTNNVLVYKISPNGYINILKNVSKYKKCDGNLYVISDEGYAVVDIKEGFCKVLYNSEVSISESSNVIRESADINVINSFDEFSKIEKDTFLDIMK